MGLIPMDTQRERDRTIRSRNRALLAVLLALAALCYAIAIVRVASY
jgi:hypothetical protein